MTIRPVKSRTICPSAGILYNAPLSGTNIQSPMNAIKAPLCANPEYANQALGARAKAAAELLEAIAGNRALLTELAVEDRARLLKAAGQVSRPDAVNRRQLVKATKRQRKAARVQRLERVLDDTGIRKLRKEP